MPAPKRPTAASARLVLLCLAAALTPAGCAQPPEPEPPNLLFILTDEQRFDTLPAYGNEVIQTPHLDALAASGVVFARAYVSQPVCSPARSTLLTGLWPHQTGVTANNIPLPDSARTLPELVGDDRYRAAFMGKWHLGRELDAQQGFDEWVAIEDGYTDDEPARSAYHHWLVDQGFEPDTDRGTFSRGFSNRLPLEFSKTTFLEQQAVAFLERRRDQPFLLYLSFLQPHTPNFGPLDSLYAPDDVPLPPTIHAELGPDAPLRYRLLREGRIRQGGPATRGEAETFWRAEIARYWGMVTQVDRSVGAVLDRLAALGLDDRTVVVFTSEHGKQMGEHGLWYKQVMYDASARVPWIVRAPGLAPRRVEQPVSHIDMVPTLLDLLGRPPAPGLPGRSLLPLMRGEDTEPRPVVLTWHANGRRAALPGIDSVSTERFEQILRERTRTIVTPDGWKLSRSDVDRPQLFNLNADPYETTNLVDRPAHRERAERMLARLRAWQETVGDTVVVR